MSCLCPQSVRTILCIGAHIDDIEIGCGGTLLRLLDEREDLRVYWWIATGSGQRKLEGTLSAQKFLSNAEGFELEQLEFQDGYLPHHSATVKDAFFRLREQCSPDWIFTHRLEDRHQDHRLLAELTWNTFRDHRILEYEIPKYEGDLGQPNFYVTLSESQCRQKLDLLQECFPSQRGKPWFERENFEALLRLRGIESRARFAEAFTARKLVY